MEEVYPLTRLRGLQHFALGGKRQRIESFFPYVETIASKQFPKKVRFVDHEGHLSTLLLKTGDDVRVDRRVNHFIHSTQRVVSEI